MYVYGTYISIYLTFTARFNDDTLDFTKLNISVAFLSLLGKFQTEVKLKNYDDFETIKIACIACSDRKLGKQIQKRKDINSFFLFFAKNKLHCNCLNIGFLEVIAAASGNKKLINLIDNYKKVIYSKTLNEVWDYIPHHKMKTKYFSKLRANFDAIGPSNVTVEQLQEMCKPDWIKKIAKLITLKKGSLRITWLIPTEMVYEAYLSALMIPQELRMDSNLKIGDWVVYHPPHVLQDLQRDYC